MLPTKLAFVDIETTGGRTSYDRIIEIGIVLVENNKVIKTYSTLLNPQAHIPDQITGLTGITPEDVEHAPTFREVAPDILELLKDYVFVAHNVRFDYGFLKSEFKRLEKSFSAKHFCTVRLSRKLFPTEHHHNLDSIISRLDIPCKNRHRALDDASAIQLFYQKVQGLFPEEVFQEAVQTVLKKPYLPIKLSEKALESLPEAPGVYLFYANEEMPLYIGKSINIKERVLSHFSGDIHSPLEMKIAQQVESIETITTAGELGALILEGRLIKKMLPLFNRMLRNKRELVALKKHEGENGYLSVTMEVITQTPLLELESFLGFFNSRKQAKTFLSELAKEYALCEKLLGLEKTTSSCFGYRLDRCKGACIGKESSLAYNLRFISAFAKTKIKPWPFPGPITIEETSELQEKTEYFLVDKWCLLGTVTADVYGSHNETLRDYAFDLDTYKILVRYLNDPKKEKKIKLVKSLPENFAM